MRGDAPQRKAASKPAPVASRAATSSLPSVAQAAPGAMALTGQIGNRGMQALLGRAQAPRAPPRQNPQAMPVGRHASALVHSALAGPGAALPDASAARLGQLLQFTHPEVREPARARPADASAPVWLADHASAQEAAAREAAAAATELPLPAATSASRRSTVMRARIHADAAAAHAARALRARAFVAGEHVFFDAGRYAPHTPQGERLLLHELVHVEQLAFNPAGLLVLRDGEGSAETAETTAVTLTVTMDHVTFGFGNRHYRPGPTRPQIWPLLLQRLLGAQYNASLEESIFARWRERVAAANHVLINDLEDATPAQVDRPIGTRRIGSRVALLLIGVLEDDFHLRVDMSEEQRELLRVGFALESAWPLLQPRLPRWYSEFMFRRQMADHAAMVRDWQRMAPTTPGHEEYSEENRSAMIEAMFGALVGPIRIVEAIRTDWRLGNAAIENPGRELQQRYRAQGGVAYRVLWGITGAATRPLTAAPPEDRVFEHYALGLLGYVHTQPDVGAAAALEGSLGHDARLELLGRFHRYMGRVVSRIGGGDERLFNVPARATDPPWNAQMSSTPPLTPPLFDAALETDHAFTMQLEFGDVFDAFAFYGYLWKFVRIPDPTSDQPIPDPLTAAGTRPSFGAVWDTRLARARRYNAADLERVRARFGDTPWGQAISATGFGTDLVRLNNTLRTLGAIVGSVLERLTQPRSTTRIVFPGPGMYVVVCRAVPVLEGDEEVTHAPSVAMLPVVARDPDEMAVSRVREASRNEFQMQLRLAEIRALLDSPFPPENAADLQAEMRELQAMLAEPGAALTSRRDLLRTQIALLRRRLDLRRRIAEGEAAATPDAAAVATLRRELFEAGGEVASAYGEREDLRGLERQLETVTDMIEMREARASGETGARFTPHATFVSDLGATLQLALEMYDRGDVDGEYQVFISDLTTPDSGDTLGTARSADESNPRVAAVLSGLQELLESHSDYGRGRVAIQIEGTVHTIRVEAGTGRMLMEGIENGVTVLSLAAIVAAPFTGGQSLWLLLPLGAIGAIPSAYRLYQRHDEHRLRFDLAAAMDVVNIVGGVIGLSHAATPLRMVRMGRVLMVAGLGADGAGMLMMGAGLVVQIENLRNLPEHERAARLLEILGGAMLQMGIQAGGMVMHSRYQGRREAAAPVREGGAPRTGESDTPGFRPPSDTSPTPRVGPAPPRAADRTTAGATPPPRPPSRPPSRPPPRVSRAARRRAAAHDRLMARFESGIDYSRPPPAADVANPPPAGQYRRRLRSDEAAFRAYNDAVAVSGGREVGLFHNPRTGEYRVMIGDETGVSAPGRSGWDAVVHFHPDGGTRLTFRLPAPHDFQGLMFRYLESGGPVREFVEFDIPGVGRGRTEYGIEPGHAEPFYVRIHRPNEAPQTLRFAHDGAFRAYWGERTVFVEPGSPLYEAMVRDIQDYVRSLDPAQTGAAPRRTEAGAGPEVRPGAGEAGTPPRTGTEGGEPRRVPAETGEGRPGPGGRTAASTRPASGRLTDSAGGLTDAGVALIRQRFRTVREFGGRRSRRVDLDNLTDAQIRERFPNEWTWLQAVVIGEARQSWIGRTTATDFLLANERQSLHQVAARLEAAVAAGGTGHTVSRGVLGRNAYEFIRERVAANDPALRPLWDALEASTNPAVRREWDRFLFGDIAIPGRTAAARQRNRQLLLDTRNGGGQGVGRGRVGDKEPDVLEVLLSQDAVHVLDPSQRWANPVHNFKSAFYEAALRQLIDVATVTSTDIGGGSRMRPTGQ
jgi:hypothetical protein